MSDGTKIEWTDATVNAVNGCSVVSPGCTNCYAMRLAGTRMRDHPTRKGLTTDTKTGPVWNGEVRLNEKAMLEPLGWRRPRRIFWNAHGDLFHESVPDEWIDMVFAVCALTPQHSHQILTKRSARMQLYASDPGSPRRVWDAASELRDTLWALAQRGALWGGEAPWPLCGVWLGVSVEDQQRADERIPDLLATPAAVRFLSCEPLLGPVNLTHLNVPVIDGTWKPDAGCDALSSYNPQTFGFDDLARAAKIDWVIVGGESGPGARPMHPDWARSLRDQCAAASVPFLFKQWGEWIPGGDHLMEDRPEFLRLRCGDRAHVFGDNLAMGLVGKRAAGRLLDGVQHDGMPV